MPPPPPGGGYTPGGGMQYAGTRTDGLAIASLVTGILSLVCCFVLLGVILGPVAAILGFISRNRITQSNGTLGGGGLAIGGLVLLLRDHREERDDGDVTLEPSRPFPRACKVESPCACKGPGPGPGDLATTSPTA